jgi:tetratricopeptide (TPR) repeat protein
MEEKRSAALMDHFGELEDPRIDRHREHKLIDLLVIAICAILCGANAWVAVETFGKAKREWFQRFLELPHGIPSHDTFGRVFALLAPEQLQAGFLSWIQLIDALQDQHLWSERYHRPLTDIFALQDEIVQKIVTTLGLQFTLVEQGTCLKVRQATNNVEAYETLLRGASYYMHFAQETNLQARQLAEKAIALDPQYAEAYALQAWTYWVEWDLQWSQDSQIVEQAFVLAQRARILDDSVPSAHMLLGYIYLWKNQPEQAVAAGERAITVSPSDDAS